MGSYLSNLSYSEDYYNDDKPVLPFYDTDIDIDLLTHITIKLDHMDPTHHANLMFP